MTPLKPGPIGVFDSGYGGLTILQALRKRLPGFDYLYLGDNARAPYGNRSFEVVYRFTLQAVRELFSRGCNLIVLGCNTASAKALRTIQQNDLPQIDPRKRVLGIIRPTAEAVGSLTRTGHVGILATRGTVASGSYSLEIAKLHPGLKVSEHACPMWVHLVENGEALGPGADYFVEKDLRLLLEKDPEIDTVILGCTHYPILFPKITEAVGRTGHTDRLHILPQGAIVADSLADYLERHPDMEALCSRGGQARFLTTENAERFSRQASAFTAREIRAEQVTLA